MRYIYIQAAGMYLYYIYIYRPHQAEVCAQGGKNVPAEAGPVTCRPAPSGISTVLTEEEESVALYVPATHAVQLEVPSVPQ
jgi:hypothetical protein